MNRYTLDAKIANIGIVRIADESLGETNFEHEAVGRRRLTPYEDESFSFSKESDAEAIEAAATFVAALETKDKPWDSVNYVLRAAILKDAGGQMIWTHDPFANAPKISASDVDALVHWGTAAATLDGFYRPEKPWRTSKRARR